MKKAFGIMVLLILVSTWLLTGCQNENSLSPRNPVTLTVWHNYGGQMKNTMDEMVDEFNATVGAERGIILSVTSISGSATLHEKLTMAAKGDPGAPQLPDMTTAYPKTALILAQEGLLADIGEQFTEEELSAYVPQFLEEGRLINDKLYVFPIAKSTEVLFVNKIIFNRFTKDTGVSFKDLKTFEGIINVAEKYYEWSDNQTPDIKNDGKTFFMIDSLFNFTLVGCEQMSDNFIKYNRPVL
jgi:multiple sugar transport system substrate-binding protein